MRIHGLTVDRGGCFHYRIRQPLTAMRDAGHWTSWGSGFDVETWGRAQVIVGQLLNAGRSHDDWIRWCEAGDKLMVWEADDDIFTCHESPAHGKAYDDPETLVKMRAMIAASHLVTVTTQALADVYREINPNVVVLPNCVPDWLTEWEMPPDPVDGSLVLGYTGSPSHQDDIAEWAPTFSRWMNRNAHRTVMRFFGPDKRPEGMPMAWRVQTRGWQAQTAEYLRALSMDIGVAPLADTVFNRGKSGIKALEYGALGIPAICSDMPQYRDVVVHGRTGFLVRSSGGWIEAMDYLWTNPARRKDMGAAARSHVREHHTQGRNIWRWELAYREAMERVGIKQ